MAQAEYAIDIAARMTGAEATTSELDALTADLMGAGKGAEFFQVAVQRVTGDLDSARAATTAANEALSAGQIEYRLLEKAALQAAKAAEKAALKNGGVIPDELKAKLDAANAQVATYATTLQGLEGKAAGAAREEKRLADTLGNVKKLSGHVDKSIAGQTESLAKLQGGLSAVGGPLGRLGSQLVAPVKGFEEMASTMGVANASAIVVAAGLAIVVVALVAVAAATVAATIAVASWAVGLADSARNTALASEAMQAMHPELRALSGTFEEVARATGATTPELQALTKQLKDAKVAAADMPAALRAAAFAEAALGKGGASGFIDDIKAGKVAVSELAAETQAKLGGIVARQMLGLEAQGTRLKSNVASIFGGLEITPALEGMQTLVGLFDKSSAAGQAMKFLFESVFQPLINQAQTAAYVVEAFALGFLIGLTKVYIAVKPTIAAIAELFGFDDASLTDTLTLAKNASEFLAKAFVVVATVLAVLTAAVGFAVVGFAAMLAIVPYLEIKIAQGLYGAFVMARDALNWVIDSVKVAIGFLGNLASTVVGALTNAFQFAIGYIKALDFAAIGTNMVLGLARGITGSAGAVLNAIGGVVSGAISSAKRLLGIASPSKVFAGIGAFTGEGFVGGVEDQTTAAQTAMTDLVTPPVTALQAVDAIQSKGGGGAPLSTSSAQVQAPAPATGGKAVDLTNSTFNFYGVKDAEHATESFGEMLTRLLEGDVAQLGGEMAPT
jgi:hypothetical protein